MVVVLARSSRGLFLFSQYVSDMVRFSSCGLFMLSQYVSDMIRSPLLLRFCPASSSILALLYIIITFVIDAHFSWFSSTQVGLECVRGVPVPIQLIFSYRINIDTLWPESDLHGVSTCWFPILACTTLDEIPWSLLPEYRTFRYLLLGLCAKRLGGSPNG